MQGKIITSEKASELLAYASETGELRWKVGSPRASVGSVAGHLQSNGYVRIRLRGRDYQAHRLAWLLTHGRWPSDQLDHINGNKADNRLLNLRECSAAENQQNQGLSRNNKSGFMGVSWHVGVARWESYITMQRKRLYLGRYETAEQAHNAYLAAKQQLHTFNPYPRS